MAQAEAVQPGRRLGEFILCEQLAEGAFGVVYRAEQPALGREVVIKVIQPRHAGRDDVRARFLREAQLASRLEHPFAAHVYASGAEPDGLLWLAMERVRGTPLSDVIAASGPMPLGRFVALFEQICEVVHAAHEQGIIHRDIKPSNIMVVGRAGRLHPKLLDFGLAKLGAEPEVMAASSPEGVAAAHVTQRGSRVGSPQYMAPEQWAAGGSADALSDQYALAIVAYECLSGRPPFAGDVLAVGRAHLGARLPALPGEQPAIDAVLARATAKQRQERFASVLELAAALRAASGIAAPEPEPPRLDDALARLCAEAPQPIAETVAAFQSARNPHQARDALDEVVRAALRYLVVVALAAESRVAAPAAAPDRARQLALRELAPEEAVRLIGDLVRPFAACRDAHPLPELVALFHDPDGHPVQGGWQAFLRAPRAAGSGEALRRQLADQTLAAAELLRALAFLVDYRLAVAREGMAELWMGRRHAGRALVRMAAAPVADGQPVLIDRDGQLVLLLHPLAQVAPPAPGAPEELFLFCGPGRRGARLVAAPVGFEIEDEAPWQRLGAWLGELDPAGDDDAEAPYRGLAPFTRDDAPRFLGRERQTEAFINRLRVQPLIAVVGPSGVGKSSFVHAGVLPALPAGWRAAVMRPGPAPLAALALCLEQALGRQALEGRLRADAGALGALLREAAGAGAPFVLVVDQFEEAFTLADPAERAALGRALALAATAAREPVRVILTVRDDFLARADGLPGLRGQVAQSLLLLGSPERDDLLRIVTEPAQRAGYGFDDPELPGRMVDAVVDRPDALALLSFTALRLWELRDRTFRRLTARAYDAMGGVGGALAQHAEATLAAMPPSEQRLVREAFRCLVTAEGTRAVATLAELAQTLGPAGPRVIDGLIAARLLVAADDGRVEIVHEALFEAWPRLREWRREDAEGARLRDQLRAAARQWVERGRPRGLLWRADVLDEYRRWRARFPSPLTGIEDEFAAASLRDAARGRRARTLAVLGAFAVLLAALAVVLALSRRAERSAAVARARFLESLEEQGRQQLLAGDPLRALAFLHEAQRQGLDGRELRFLLARALELIAPQRVVLRHDAPVRALALSSDGARLVTTTTQGELAVWDAASGALQARAATRRAVMTNVLVSPDGAWLATAGADAPAARLWAADTLAARATLPHGAVVSAVAFSPDGRRLLTASADRTARIWSVPDGRLERVLATDHSVDGCGWSPDGARVLTWSFDEPPTEWDAAQGAVVARYPLPDMPPGGRARFGPGGELVFVWRGTRAAVWREGGGAPIAVLDHPREILDLAVSDDGAEVVTTCDDHATRFWQPRSGKLLQLMAMRPGDTNAIFCPGGRLAVGASRFGPLRLWDGESGRLVSTFYGHTDQVHALACDPAHRRIFSGGADGSARIWDLDASSAVSFPSGSAGVTMLDVSADGRRLLTAGLDRRVVVWDLGRRAAVATLQGRQGNQWAAFSPDGRQVVVASDLDKVVDVWDVASQRVTATLDHPAIVTFAVFSPDGGRIATTSVDGAATLWDARRAVPIVVLRGHTDQCYSAGFSPDGLRVVTAGADQSMRVWDAASGRQLMAMAGQPSALFLARFDGSGRRIVSAGGGMTVRVWDAERGTQLMALAGHTSLVHGVAWSPGGALIASTGFDGMVNVWDADSGRLLSSFTDHRGEAAPAVFADDHTLVSAGDDDGFVVVRDLGLEDRDAAALDAVVAQRTPFVVREGKLAQR